MKGKNNNKTKQNRTNKGKAAEWRDKKNNPRVVMKINRTRKKEYFRQLIITDNASSNKCANKNVKHKYSRWRYMALRE